MSTAADTTVLNLRAVPVTYSLARDLNLEADKLTSIIIFSLPEPVIHHP
jgi:hypothetical protein